jgi:hypothetical protein
MIEAESLHTVALARQLVDARRTRVPVSRPMELSMGAAEVVKHEVLRLLTNERSRSIAGYKVSLGCT